MGDDYDLSDIGFNWDGNSFGVLPDVSMSEPAQQPRTATGTGTGYYVDNGWLNAITGTVQTALNYAIVRDQQQIAKNTGFTVGVPVTATPQAQAAIANNRLLLIGGVGIALALILSRG
jgi:hypothetical protein